MAQDKFVSAVSINRMLLYVLSVAKAAFHTTMAGRKTAKQGVSATRLSSLMLEIIRAAPIQASGPLRLNLASGDRISKDE
jgi:hypothetical protein